MLSRPTKVDLIDVTTRPRRRRRDDFEKGAGRDVARLTGERVILQDDGNENANVDMY